MYLATERIIMKFIYMAMHLANMSTLFKGDSTEWWCEVS